MSSDAGERATGSRGARGSAAFAAVSEVLGGYEPGFALRAGRRPEAVERFVVLSVRGSPRLLLPPERTALRSALAGFLGNRRPVGLAAPLVGLAARVGGPLASVCSEASLTSRDDRPAPLRTLIADAVGRDDFRLALRLSFDRPNAKTVAMAISDAGEPLCFAKFGSEAMTDDLVAHESAALERFEGVADMPVVMPRRLHSGTWANGHNVLITAPLRLAPLERDALVAHRAADAFAFGSRAASAALRDSAYWRRTRERAERLGGGDDRAQLLATLTEIDGIWGGHRLDFGASHGDWARANLGLVEGRVAALDWERCTELAPHGIDIAHFVLCESASLGQGGSIDNARAAESLRRHLADVGRPPEDAEPLIALALLEMVIRFESARDAGIRSVDSKFSPALKAGLQAWAS